VADFQKRLLYNKGDNAAYYVSQAVNLQPKATSAKREYINLFISFEWKGVLQNLIKGCKSPVFFVQIFVCCRKNQQS